MNFNVTFCSVKDEESRDSTSISSLRRALLHGVSFLVEQKLEQVVYTSLE